MGSNIIELAKLGHERAAELNASCGAVDVRSVAKLISDLATQLEVQLVRGNAQAVQLANAESKCRELVAENAGLKKALTTIANSEEFHGDTVVCDFNTLVTAAWSVLSETPATDAFLAEVRAHGVEMFSEKFGGGTLISDMVKEIAKDFAAQLRKGGAA
ncbi:hypothetical protein NAY64_000631 [Salmonella enterica]|nr:hypothetical protein [Salmonella enterica]